jgi:hypothetical protein
MKQDSKKTLEIKSKSFIFAGLFSGKDKEYESKINLACAKIKSLGGILMGCIIQRRGVSRSKKPGGSKRMGESLNAKYIFSTGKIRELIELVNSSGADMLIFYNSLNKTQRSVLRHISQCEVYSFLDDFENDQN